MGCGPSSQMNTAEKKIDGDDAEKEKKPPQPSPPPPYILSEIFNDLVANIKGVSSKTGKADRNGLILLMKEICIISGGDVETMPQPEHMDRVSVHLNSS